MVRVNVPSLTCILAFLLALPAHGQVNCPTAIFGSTTADPLFINTPITVPLVPSSCTYDFNGRHVILGPAATINVQSATFRAGKLTMQPGSILRSSNGGTIRWIVAAAGANDGGVDLQGLIDVDDSSSAGWIDITAGPFVNLSGSGKLSAKGTIIDAWGGTVDLTADGSVSVNGAATSIDCTSGNDGFGGSVTLVSNNTYVETFKKIDCQGGSSDGGWVWIDANTSVYVGGPIDCDGIGSAALFYGYGGDIDIYAGTSITIANTLDANGATGDSANGGGDGGYITFDAGGLVAIAADVKAEGGYFSYGGDVYATSGTSLSQTTGQISARGKAAGSYGGTVDVTAGTTAIFSALVTANGGSSDGGAGGSILVVAQEEVGIHGTFTAEGNAGGSVDVTSARSRIVHDGVVTASASGAAGAFAGPYDGSGGSILLTSFGDMDLSNGDTRVYGAGATGQGGSIGLDAGPILTTTSSTHLYADGNPSHNGSPGSISILGCRMTFQAQSRIWARGDVGGPGGMIDITAHDRVALLGEVRADSLGVGTITIRTRLSSAVSPVTAGTTVFLPPNPVINSDPTLPPCLARLTTAFTAVPQVPQGGSISVSLQSVPNAPLLVLWDLSPSNYQALPDPLLGHTQCLLFGTPFYPLADYFNITGLPLFPGGSGNLTGPTGAWNYALGPINAPGLIGFTVYVEAYVIDLAALNGLFHQPRRVAYSFI